MEPQQSLEATLESTSDHRTIIDRFRQAWRQGQTPELNAVVAGMPAASSAALAELIAVDLEQRIARGESVRLEDYLAQFPAISSDERLVLTLIERDFVLRSTRDSTVTSHDYLERFPAYRNKLSSLFESRATRVREQTASWGSQGLGADTFPNIQFEAVEAKLPAKIGRFEVCRWLGSGAFGDVYEAHDLQLDRRIAIKVAKLQRGDAELRIKRFLREAKAAAGLRHPNIVPVYEFGQEGEHFYIASAFIQGRTLKEHNQSTQQIDLTEAVRIAKALAEALAYSHSQGIVHRDIKPANIMLDESGTPLLMDFGLASRLDEAEELTQTGQQLGTPLYMSPEQARGKSGAALPASDQYSLGVVLYELITGKTPFTGTVEMLMYHQQATEAPPPRQWNRSISPDLETICLKCLQKSPEQRYATTAELADDLRRLELGDPIRARRESLATRFLRRIRRNPIVTAAIVLIALSVFASAWVWKASHGQREQARIDRRLAELQSSAQQLLANPRLEPTYLDEAEQVVEEMEELRPASTAEDRQRFLVAYADRISQTFQDRILEEEIEPIEQALIALHNRDPKLANSVRAEFRQRQTAWSPRLTLATPFANLGEVFDGKAYRLEVTDQGTAIGREMSGPMPPGTYVGSKLPCGSALKLVVTFDATWQQLENRIAITLPGGKGQYYSFTLSAPSELATDGAGSSSFAEAGKRGNKLSLLIDRTHATQTDVVAIRGYAVEDILSSSTNGTLRLEVRREGERLSFSINQLPAIEFEDAIPLRAAGGATISFSWPPGLKLQSLASFERTLPEVASVLENADAVFNRGEYDEALRFYQEAISELTGDEVSDECHYKQGLCFLAMDDRQNAKEKFLFVANRRLAESDQLPRWTIRANCQLLRHYLGEKSADGYEQANRVLDRLNLLRGDRRAEIPPLISNKERVQMVYDAAGSGLSVYFRAPQMLVENCERVDRVADLIDASNLDRMYAKVTLIRAHRLTGGLERAQQLTSEWLANFTNCRADTLFGKDVFAEHVWLLLERQVPPERLQLALKDVDRWLYATSKGIRQESNRSARDLLIERARLLIALQREGEAEANLELFLSESDKRRPDQSAPKYVNYADACLLLGCLQERRGANEKALETWKKAIWRDARAEFFGVSQFPENGMPIVYHMILSSLTGEAGDFDARRMMLSMLSNRQGSSGSNEMFKQLTTFFKIDSMFVEQAWLSDSGKQWSRRVAFRNLSYEEFTRLPIKILMAHYIRNNAFDGELTLEEEEIAALFVDQALQQIQQGKLNHSKIILLGTIWNGVNLPGLAGWSQAAPALAPELRGPVAALFGQRYLTLGRQAEAKTFFQDAMKVAAFDSTLRKVVEAGLQRVEEAEKLRDSKASELKPTESN